jgi:hypothetical protein
MFCSPQCPLEQQVKLMLTFAGEGSDFERLCFQRLSSQSDGHVYLQAPEPWLREYWLECALNNPQASCQLLLEAHPIASAGRLKELQCF